MANPGEMLPQNEGRPSASVCQDGIDKYIEKAHIQLYSARLPRALSLSRIWVNRVVNVSESSV